MRLQINGDNREVAAGATLDDLVLQLSLVPQRVAIELNGTVVRRNEWGRTILKEDDRLEIVHFVGGGGIRLLP